MIKKVKKGFTLIELVVVIAVIAILSAVSVVAYVGITNNAKKSAAQQEADQIAMTIRAAALTSTDGYTEREVEGVAATSTTARYRVVWTQDGLTFERLNSQHLKVADILKDMYNELEEKDLATGVVLVATKDFVDTEGESPVYAKKVEEVKSFKYQTESYSKGVEAFFVK